MSRFKRDLFRLFSLCDIHHIDEGCRFLEIFDNRGPHLDPSNLPVLSNPPRLIIIHDFFLFQADPDKLRETALSLDLPHGEGVLNWEIKFAGPGQKNAGQNIFASAAINQWQNGEMKLIFPTAIASSDLK